MVFLYHRADARTQATSITSTSRYTHRYVKNIAASDSADSRTSVTTRRTPARRNGSRSTASLILLRSSARSASPSGRAATPSATPTPLFATSPSKKARRAVPASTCPWRRSVNAVGSSGTPTRSATTDRMATRPLPACAPTALAAAAGTTPPTLTTPSLSPRARRRRRRKTRRIDGRGPMMPTPSVTQRLLPGGRSPRSGGRLWIPMPTPGEAMRPLLSPRMLKVDSMVRLEAPQRLRAEKRTDAQTRSISSIMSSDGTDVMQLECSISRVIYSYVYYITSYTCCTNVEAASHIYPWLVGRRLDCS